jgi:hypothetical protein
LYDSPTHGTKTCKSAGFFFVVSDVPQNSCNYAVFFKKFTGFKTNLRPIPVFFHEFYGFNAICMRIPAVMQEFANSVRSGADQESKRRAAEPQCFPDRS